MVHQHGADRHHPLQPGEGHAHVAADVQQAGDDDRVRLRRGRRPPLRPSVCVHRGVPGRVHLAVLRDVRQAPRRALLRRRDGVELCRLPHRAGDHPRPRQQEGMFTARQPKMAAHALRSRYSALANATRPTRSASPPRRGRRRSRRGTPHPPPACPPHSPYPWRQPQTVRPSGDAPPPVGAPRTLGIRGREFYAPRPAAAAPHRTVASGAPRPPRQRPVLNRSNTHPIR